MPRLDPRPDASLRIGTSLITVTAVYIPAQSC